MPKVLKAVDPEYSNLARKKKIQGNVLLNFQVDTNGTTSNIVVKRSLRYGLDEKAIDAVSHYLFRPAMRNGEPVAVTMNIEVTFQIF